MRRGTTGGGPLLWAISVAAVVAFASVAWADEPPPHAPDPISLDRASPSVIGFGNTPGDIYGEVPPGGIVGLGWDVAGGVGPILHVKDTTYGLLTPTDNNDGHSNGEANPQATVVVYFSGDDASLGVFTTDYDHQAFRAQAAGDRFVTNGPTTLSPAAVMGGAGPAGIAGPVLAGGQGNFSINLLSVNQTRYNEIPSIGPLLFNAYAPPAGATMMDDMDALELTPFDLNQDWVHDTPIFFSLDAASPSMAGPDGLFGNADDLFPGDVLVCAPPVPAPGIIKLFAPFGTLGIVAADEVDALAVWDDGDLIHTPGIDYALFSLAPGSPFLDGLDGLSGTLDDLSAADIFVTDFTGANAPFLSAGAIGMLFTDNVDAIDVEIWVSAASIELWDETPEPGTLALLALGGLVLVRRRKP